MIMAGFRQAGQNMTCHHHPGLSVQVISVSKQKHSAKPVV